MKTEARSTQRTSRPARRTPRKSQPASPATAPLAPPPATSPFFIVGVGASAGGLEAIGKFFGNMEPDCGLAFVVVQHLSPDHRSFMVELLSKRTRIPVQRAEDGQAVHPNNIYLIPPKKHLKIQQGRLRLVEPEHDRGINLPIDVFFRSLAEDQGHRAIGVILSGTGSDGTTGVRAIKDAGGMVMVQSESTAQFAGMPRSAISTGLADFVLAPEDMGRQLMQYLQHPFVAKAQALSRDQSTTEMLMNKLFVLLRERCGVDFSQYKPATIDRRIERRMSINQIHSLQEYVQFVERSSREAGLLFNELLICVTRFFRDKPAWEFLDTTVLPKVFERATERSLRAWVPGCSTGEEAYSLAMLLAEQAEKREQSWDIKVFATDISKDSIESASAGFYPESVVADVPPALLRKYFVRRDDGYYVRESLRKLVVFARHDLLKDPPFTKLDLVSCRNVLIYFQPNLQGRAISLFHFALKPDGVLFLGNSETLGDLADLYQTLSVRHKIFQSRSGVRGRRLQFNLQPALSEPVARTPSLGPRLARGLVDFGTLETIYREALADYAAACIVIDEHGDILHLLGKAGDYLKQPSGAFTNNLLKLTAHNLSSALATALHKAAKSGGDFIYDNVRFKHGHELRALRLRIKTVHLGPRGGCVRLVFLEEKTGPARSGGKAEQFELDKNTSQHIADLEQELTYTKESLQATIEELETANEELQATNEELLASNEELQSTNEELQSVNEELHTVNVENQSRIEELAELTNDINNLLAISAVGTMLVDRTLRIRRMSTALYGLTALTPDDINAPLEVLCRALRFPDVIGMAEEVLATEKPREKEVLLANGRWLLMRLAPYRAEPPEKRGLVLTLIDITSLKESELKLADSEQRYRLLAENSRDLISLRNLDGQYLYVSPSFKEVLGYEPPELLGQSALLLVHPDDLGLVREALQQAAKGETPPPIEYRVRSKHDRHLWLESVLRPIRDDTGRVVNLLAASRDITARKGAEERLRESQELTRAILDAISAHVAVVDASGEIIHVNEAWRRFAAANAAPGGGNLNFGANYFEACQKATGPFREDALRCLEGLQQVLRGERECFEMEYPCHSPTEERWFLLHATRLPGPQPGLVIAHLNITERIKAEAARLELERHLQEAQKFESLGVLAGGVAHDFNNLLQNMLGQTALACQELPSDSPAHARLQQVQTAIHRASDLCRQMLAYAGKGQAPRQFLDLNTVIADTLPLVSVSLHKQARCSLELAPELPQIHADPVQVRQVIMNLLLNASDALEGRQGLITVRTGTLRADRATLNQARGGADLPEGEYVFLEVSDTGCGMKPEVQAKIFDPFFTTKFIGRGLGLAAVQGIVRSHCGAIRVESAEGQGSTFRVLWPRAEAPAPPRQPAPTAESGWRGQGLVLVMDSDPHVGQLLTRLLSSFGFEPHPAGTPEDALSWLHTMDGKVRLALLGTAPANAPEAAALHEYLRSRPQLPVLLLSSLGEQDLERKVLGGTVAGVLTKPFSPDALREKIRAVLE